MSQKSNKKNEDHLVEDLISCLQKRKRNCLNHNRKLQKISDLLEEPIDLEWENFYERLRAGYRAIQEELQE